MGWVNTPNIGTLIIIRYLRGCHRCLIRVAPDVPIYELGRLLPIDEQVFGNWHWFVLEWVPVSRKPSASTGSPTRPLRLDPNYVVNKFKLLLRQEAMEIERNRYPLRGFTSGRSPDEYRGC